MSDRTIPTISERTPAWHADYHWAEPGSIVYVTPEDYALIFSNTKGFIHAVEIPVEEDVEDLTHLAEPVKTPAKRGRTKKADVVIEETPEPDPHTDLDDAIQVADVLTPGA